MRIGKKLILLLCLAALVVAAQETRLAGPVSGFLFDPQLRAVRPIMGVLGASYLGEAVVPDVDYASVSPDGRFAIAVRGGSAILIRGLGEGRLESVELEGASGVTRAAWSADSAAVALWSDAGDVEAWSELTAAPRRTLSAGLGPLAAVAVAAGGRAVVAASKTGAILLASEGAAVRQMLELERPTALALAGNRLFVADAARNEILAIGNYLDGGDAQMFAGAARGVEDPSALAISPDQKSLLVAGRSARSLTAYSLATSEALAVAALDFEPTRLEAFSGSLFALTSGGDSGPFQVLDGARSLAVYFVPAAPAAEMED
jgi:hypothetical protein